MHSSLQQFRNLSSWRKETVTIDPHEVKVIDFIDTNPNMFYIVNPNIAILKVGIGSMPRSNSFEYKVEANTSEIVGRPEGSTKLYILNDSRLEITVTVFSVNKEFDPAILKNTTVVIDGYEIVTGSEITGIREGITMPTEEKNSYLISKALSDILTKLGSGIQETNSSNILGQAQSLVALLSSLMTEDVKLINILSMLDTIAKNTEKIEISAENVTAIAYDDKALLGEINKLTNNVKPVFENNAFAFSYTCEKKTYFKFLWLLNDGGLTNLKINDNIVLTIFEGERFTDLAFELNEGDTIKLESETPMYRIAYTPIESI